MRTICLPITTPTPTTTHRTRNKALDALCDARLALWRAYLATDNGCTVLNSQCKALLKALDNVFISA